MQMVECVPPPLEPEKEAVSPMKAEEHCTPEELSATQMIENLVGDLEPVGSELVITPPKAGKEAGTNEIVAEKIPTQRGLEARVHEVVEFNKEGEEIGKACPSSNNSQLY